MLNIVLQKRWKRDENMSKISSGNGHASSTSGNQSIVSMFKKQLKNVERRTVPETTSSFIAIDVSDEDCSTGITVEECPNSDSAQRDILSSGSAKRDVSSAVSSQARRSSRLSMKRRRNAETAKDAEGASSVGISAGAGCKERRRSCAKETQSTTVLQDQNSCTIKTSENTAISDSETKHSKTFHKTDTSKIKPCGFVIHSLEDKDDKTPDVDSNVISDENREDSTDAQVPYYLENFLHVLKTVTEDEFYSELFNDDDRTVIRTFEELPGKFGFVNWFVFWYIFWNVTLLYR